MENIYLRKYIQVPANDEVVLEYPLGAGDKMFIYEIGGNAAQNQNTKVDIRFGNDTAGWEYHFATHGDSIHIKPEINLEGGAGLKLQLRLINDISGSETMGGFVKAQKY